MSTQKHTPTPWSLNAKNPESSFVCETARWIIRSETKDMRRFDSIDQAQAVDLANAAHIVKCVNLHDEFVEVLETLRHELRLGDIGAASGFNERFKNKVNELLTKAKG